MGDHVIEAKDHRLGSFEDITTVGPEDYGAPLHEDEPPLFNLGNVVVAAVLGVGSGLLAYLVGSFIWSLIQ